MELERDRNKEVKVDLRIRNYSQDFEDEQNDLSSINLPSSIQRCSKDVDMLAKLAKKGPRSKSTDPRPHSPKLEDPFIRDVVKENEREKPILDSHKRWSTIIRQSEMSQQEMMNSYRLLMNDHLRLERFLSIMTKDNEIIKKARNRLESDLLDAMMCIEDLKQALEIKMARRRKVDPREAEERRYLIRQNKKLLNQLYDSAKKIESLELTKLEMHEQLDLLDFQIIETENQKSLLEDELNKRRMQQVNVLVQTEDNTDNLENKLYNLQEEINYLKLEHAEEMKSTVLMKGKIRQLQQENNELKDQINRLEDSENSLVESDKHLLRRRQQQETIAQPVKESAYEPIIASLNKQVDELRDALYAIKKREYIQAESQSTPRNMTEALDDLEFIKKLPDNFVNIDDKLVSDVIRTYQAMLDEKDEQLRRLRAMQSTSSSLGDSSQNLNTESSSLEVSIQTMPDNRIAAMEKLVSQTALFLTKAELQELWSELTSKASNSIDSPDEITFAEILGYVRLLKTSNCHQEINQEIYENGDSIVAKTKVDHLHKKLEELITENIKWRRQAIKSHMETPSILLSTYGTEETDTSSGEIVKNPNYFSDEFEKLKTNTQVDSLKSHLQISERRKNDLERALEESAREIVKLKNDFELTSTELQASLRTQASLRRRLLTAMEANGGGIISFENKASSNQRTVVNSFFGTASQLNEDLNEYASSPSDVTESEHSVNDLKIQNHQLENQVNQLSELIKVNMSKIAEQNNRITCIEADNRALIDRVNTIQSAESSTQKGIVKLQMLYEDMLREYSECQSRQWHETTGPVRSSSRSKLKHADSQQQISKLKKKIEMLEKQTQNQPLCGSTSCADVRVLLKAFQNRFIITADKLTEVQQRCNDLERLIHEKRSLNESEELIIPTEDVQLIRRISENIQGILSSSQEVGLPKEMTTTLKGCLDDCDSVIICFTNRKIEAQTVEARLKAKLLRNINPSYPSDL